MSVVAGPACRECPAAPGTEVLWGGSALPRHGAREPGCPFLPPAPLGGRPPSAGTPPAPGHLGSHAWSCWVGHPVVVAADVSPRRARLRPHSRTVARGSFLSLRSLTGFVQPWVEAPSAKPGTRALGQHPCIPFISRVPPPSKASGSTNFVLMGDFKWLGCAGKGNYEPPQALLSCLEPSSLAHQWQSCASPASSRCRAPPLRCWKLAAVREPGSELCFAEGRFSAARTTETTAGRYL